MRYLLDVNALIALGLEQHEFYVRISKWVKSQSFPSLLTCSITELGFVRVLAQTPVYGPTVREARDLLLEMKKSQELSLTFVPDANDISKLPDWAATPRQTTDAHLLQLAASHSAALATFDERIPGATLIP